MVEVMVEEHLVVDMEDHLEEDMVDLPVGDMVDLLEEELDMADHPEAEVDMEVENLQVESHQVESHQAVTEVVLVDTEC